uniref:Uncharacterized protein n=1 Tax=Leishmania guyanensis TaxID=5670 RepID=A0A1E1J930_LEIGU|nr:Hypothetical protein BN36_NA76190 [Leishmania guyanensis]
MKAVKEKRKKQQGAGEHTAKRVHLCTSAQLLRSPSPPALLFSHLVRGASNYLCSFFFCLLLEEFSLCSLLCFLLLCTSAFLPSFPQSPLHPPA